MSKTYHHGYKQKERHFGLNWYWYRSTPSWWNKLHHHKPKRREHRDMLRNVVKGEVEQTWPLDKKPHKYYW